MKVQVKNKFLKIIIILIVITVKILLPDLNKDVYYIDRVIDGDTFNLTDGTKEIKVRLIGVDTPESVHPNQSKNTEFGREVSNKVKELLPKGTKVLIEYDIQETDKYGRHLVYLYFEHKGSHIMLNEYLLRNRMAKISTYPPNVKYVDRFRTIAGE